MEVRLAAEERMMWIESSNSSENNQSKTLKVLNSDVFLAGDNPVLALVLFSFCLATVLGNALVIAAVARERYLHTVTNYFITSLAVADCLVGSIVMPFSAAVEMQSDRRWIFGRDLWYCIQIPCTLLPSDFLTRLVWSLTATFGTRLTSWPARHPF